AAVLTLLPEMLHDFEKFRLIVYGGFILVTLYFLPNGVMGLLERRGAAPAGGRSARHAVQPDFAATAGASLELDNVSKNFGGLQALRDVSFRVAPGSIHALIGPNGAGKTTLINVITGFYRTDGGAVLINGQAANISRCTMPHAAASFAPFRLSS